MRGFAGTASGGFTLIELSIVLVIIGLIVGGILAGQELVKSAAIRAQITQIEKYQTAANTFHSKYGYLPGNIKDPEATQFGFASRGPYAGEGDGNGVIEANPDNIAGQGFGTYAFQGEEAMFWVDLSKTGLVDGSFNTATPTAVPGSNISGMAINAYFPQAKLGNSGYVYVWSGGWRNAGVAYAGGSGDAHNYFALTAVTGAVPGGFGGTPLSVQLMTPAQAYAVDKKADDGLPQGGNILAMTIEGWAASGSMLNISGIQLENARGDADPAVNGPVKAGDGIATNGPNQGVMTTCYDNNNIASAIENYSLSSTLVNCSLSFGFQ